MKWFFCCGNDSQHAPPGDGKVSILNLDNPSNNRTVVPANDSPSDNALLLATSSHPSHSGTKKNNNTDLQEVASHLSNKASIV